VHEFPDGNITLAEVAAFLRRSFKSWDIVDRIIWNSTTTGDITALINKYRKMLEGPIANNTVYRMMRDQMDKRANKNKAYKTWTVGGHENIEEPGNFDSTCVSVKGFCRPVVFRNRFNEATVPILFKDLAKGLATMPECEDVSDPTRCVQYCNANPDDGWMYSNDFQQLFGECLDGPVQVFSHHGDAQVLLRLRTDTGLMKLRHIVIKNHSYGSIDGSDEEAGKKQGKREHSEYLIDNYGNKLDSLDTHKNTHKKPSGKSQASCTTTERIESLHSRFNFANVDSEDDANDDAYQGPKRFNKSIAAPCRSRCKKLVVSYDVAAMLTHGDEVEGNGY
jgi:hypothetical protein